MKQGNSEEHFVLSTFSENNASIVISLISIIAITCFISLFWLYGNRRLNAIVSVILLLCMLSYISLFIRGLWRRAHMEHHIFFDICNKGIAVAPMATSNQKKVYYIWEEIEAMTIYPQMRGNFILLIKPYQKKTEKFIFDDFFWGNYVPRIIRKIRYYSGRDNIIKKMPYGLPLH